MRTALPLLLLAVAIAGCRNPCQRTCVQMRVWAEDCGFTVSDAEFDQCIDDAQIVSSEDREVCREAGDRGTIERSWDCDQAALYWAIPIDS